MAETTTLYTLCYPSLSAADRRFIDEFRREHDLLGLLSVATLHKFCIYSGLVGAVVYFAVSIVRARYGDAVKPDAPSDARS